MIKCNISGSRTVISMKGQLYLSDSDAGRGNWMKMNTKWLVAGAVAVVIAAAVVMTAVIQTAKDIELNDEQLASLTAGLNDHYSYDTEYRSFHIKYYGSKWAGCSTRLFVTGTSNGFYKNGKCGKLHHESADGDIIVVDTVIDGNDVKIKDIDILSDEDRAEPGSKSRSKIPQDIYSKMKPEDPDKYLKEDTEKARAYFNSLK